ncbi:MAG: hypothetical protein LIP01_13400 [Tannerellaceae bacterium]|nr:hypothetical protein [Tannerellaceae bacterium]
MKNVCTLTILLCMSLLPLHAGDVTIHWNQEKQTIDGFGVSQAGWSYPLYAHHQRDKLMELLFDQEGLQLNILRGEIYPHYWENENDTSFNLEDDILIPFDHPLLDKESDDAKRRGQHWITKQAKEKYKVEKLLFSAWSAPAYMKSNKNASGGHLRKDYYQAYADYLAAFYKAYQAAGMEPYAISPSNEPGYAAPWNSSVWSADKMGEFLTKHLGPTFQKEKVDAKIVFGENPFWSATTMLSSLSSEDFVNTILEEYPDILNYNPIASGHGYTFPEIKGMEMLNGLMKTSIVPFHIAEDKNIPVWMTEISTTDPLDLSMENGMFWAETFHEYLTTANVSAFIWWGGAMPAGNNECLIELNKNRKEYTLSKRYETFGNFTRYIPSGSKRIETTTSTELLVSAYKKENKYTVVIINNNDNEQITHLSIEGANPQNTLTGYLTNNDKCWETQSIKADKTGKFSVSIPAQSVITFTGTVK